MEKITIRELTLEDLDDFFVLFSTLIHRDFPEYTDKTREAFLTDNRLWSKQMYQNALQKKSRILLGAYHDHKLVGIFDAISLLGGVCLGVWLMVEPEYRHKGIGTKLLQQWEKQMIDAGIHSLQLYADARNVKYYSKQGFELVGICKKTWFGVDEYFFTKLIQQPKEENYLR